MMERGWLTSCVDDDVRREWLLVWLARLGRCVHFVCVWYIHTPDGDTYTEDMAGSILRQASNGAAILATGQGEMMVSLS